jgi:hypothetical protein
MVAEWSNALDLNHQFISSSPGSTSSNLVHIVTFFILQYLLMPVVSVGNEMKCDNVKTKKSDE